MFNVTPILIVGAGAVAAGLTVLYFLVETDLASTAHLRGRRARCWLLPSVLASLPFR